MDGRKHFRLHHIEAVTNDFSEDHKIGWGAYADVYKAVLNGEEIAVKRLHPLQGLDDRDFNNEFRNLYMVHHENIIRLIGCCYETRHSYIEHNGELLFVKMLERLLLFEYMQGGSLDKYIEDEPCGLDWPTCYQIIRGTCEGLNHLHNAYDRPIFHMDLKPAKILLDRSMTPKLAGLGLSRRVASTKSHQTEITRGTLGYMPPEYLNNRTISKKFDVFSLGVIIIKVMSGNMGYIRHREMSPEDFIEFVSENWKKRFHAWWEYPSHEIELVQVRTCVGIALRCVDEDPEKRPSIEDIVLEMKEPEAESKKVMSLPPGSTTAPGPPFIKGVPSAESSRTVRGLGKGVSGKLYPREVQCEEAATRTQDLSVTMSLPPNESKDLIPKMGSKLPHISLQQKETKPQYLKLQHLRDITNNFSEDRILGRGGFSVVYKGVLENGEMVAVKKLLQAMPSSEQQFDNEVDLLMKLKHPNVVRLVGYCCNSDRFHMPYKGKSVFASSTEYLLCLECLPNGSLDKYISDPSSGLDWHTRYKIIEGISSGLQYLHEQSNDPIIHVDLKPANILLDENMTPKITDFGLSRLFDQKQTTQTTIASGTRGYMPPEHDQGKITPMWDIFSFGVIIMEVITGHRGYPYPHEMEKSAKGFIERELQKWRNILQNKPGYTSLETDCQQIEICIQIGLICVNPERTERPTMKKIVDMLQGLESMNCYISNDELSCLRIQEEP